MDKYDKEIEEIKKELETDPLAIVKHGSTPTPLFQYVTNRPNLNELNGCGCLIQIKRNLVDLSAFKNGRKDFELTNEIKKDERIPSRLRKTTLSDLPVLAEWQRKIDKLYNREMA